eukprot:TRINITY_DN12625_c0_g1_i1.p1 TRINITY_DN12625_c0_g1~~TRINITY_DN12625_c0_g1_i1.p1  ORF type:complete len:394 (+),score=65.92 TRINITY_DN12625_c0_g1_i1:107-1288(+)
MKKACVVALVVGFIKAATVAASDDDNITTFETTLKRDLVPKNSALDPMAFLNPTPEAQVQNLTGCMHGGTVEFPSEGTTHIITACRARELTFSFSPDVAARVPAGEKVRFIIPGPLSITTEQNPVFARVVTIEDASECQVDGYIHWVSEGFNFKHQITDCGNDTVTLRHHMMVQPPAGTAIYLEPAPGNDPAGGPGGGGGKMPLCFAQEGSVQILKPRPPLGGRHLEERQSLSQLRIGDTVRGGDDFSRVIGFLHVLHGQSKTLVVEHAAGYLRLSGNHLVFVDGQAKMAGAVKIGESISLADGRLSQVLAIRSDMSMGMISPLTASGFINVDGARASTYAATFGLEVPHAAMHSAFFGARLAVGLSGLLARGSAKHTAQFTAGVADVFRTLS